MGKKKSKPNKQEQNLKSNKHGQKNSKAEEKSADAYVSAGLEVRFWKSSSSRTCVLCWLVPFPLVVPSTLSVWYEGKYWSSRIRRGRTRVDEGWNSSRFNVRDLWLCPFPCPFPCLSLCYSLSLVDSTPVQGGIKLLHLMCKSAKAASRVIDSINGVQHSKWNQENWKPNPIILWAVMFFFSLFVLLFFCLSSPRSRRGTEDRNEVVSVVFRSLSLYAGWIPGVYVWLDLARWRSWMWLTMWMSRVEWNGIRFKWDVVCEMRTFIMSAPMYFVSAPPKT